MLIELLTSCGMGEVHFFIFGNFSPKNISYPKMVRIFKGIRNNYFTLICTFHLVTSFKICNFIEKYSIMSRISNKTTLIHLIHIYCPFLLCRSTLKEKTEHTFKLTLCVFCVIASFI